jgi:RHS repeat-associated protein
VPLIGPERRSFRIEQTGEATSPVVKKFAMPERLPYDVSTGSFSIVAEDAELDGLMDRMLEERAQPEASPRDVLSGSPPQAAQQSPAPQGGGSMMTLSVPRTGSFYIYSFDGRLLAEYDMYGTCLRDYIYMGSRLVAEYVPATGQYFYYLQDQIGSTRIVTNDSGTVVYAEAHDPYGGIQKTWVNEFDPKRKFSDKERDGETGLDYFGARYYSAPDNSEGHRGSYRWLSIDPKFNTFAVLADPQASNLYSYCRNNPLSLRDPDGRIVICGDRAAFEALKRSIGDGTLADKITWDPVTGMIFVEDIETNNENYESLKTLVGLDSVVRVSLVDRPSYQTAEGKNEAPLFTCRIDIVAGEKIISGWFGLTVFPKGGRPAGYVHGGSDIRVYVARGVLRNEKSEQARTLAEELYGHAFLYVTGKPFEHEFTRDGYVEAYIDKIRRRKY